MSLTSLVKLSVRRPRTILAIAILATAAFAAVMPQMTLDTNPKNVLAADAPVRVRNREVDRIFALREHTIVVGIEHPPGVLNPGTLARIVGLTGALRELPEVSAGDVASLATVTRFAADGEGLVIEPLLTEAPRSAAELARLRSAVHATPLIERLLSRDEKVTAIHVPLVEGADIKVALDRVRAAIDESDGPERIHVTGDPVVQETFGSQMFVAMGALGPLAGVLMLVIAWLLFRRASMAFAVMGVATLVIVWAMGFIVALGFPVHIMSSMAPVFLMAIATDAIHVFNELTFQERHERSREEAIVRTMRAVARPVLFTDLTTALAFAMLMTSSFGPIRVFGLAIAFGTAVLLLFTFTVVPALLALTPPSAAAAARPQRGRFATLLLRRLTFLGVEFPRATLVACALLVVASVAGMSQIRINDNQLAWFGPGSEIRRADALINESLGGSGLAYVVVDGHAEGALKSPAALRHIEELQRGLERLPGVGLTSSVVDSLKRMHRVLHRDDPRYEVVPDDEALVAQYLFLLGTSGRPADVDNVLDPTARWANVTVQLRTWDVSAMREVAAATARFERALGGSLRLEPAGIAHLNLVWNDEVLWDVIAGFLVALLAVFAVLALNFRSARWAAVSFAPLLLTIVILYGVVGLAGKDFDMPISVLSTLSLGMAVDFAIHFIARFRQALAERRAREGEGEDGVTLVKETLLWTASRPGRGIFQNALLFGGAFSVMLFASLTPYVTVGAFMVSMMFLSATLTLLVVPALIMLLGPSLRR
jgi:uncharacterized protein